MVRLHIRNNGWIPTITIIY